MTATAIQRTFTDAPAVRKAIPVLLGISGAQGSGKTWSALEVATGIQQVVGGDIYGCDSENGRMLHYADHFKFRHVPFGAPFSPLDYLAVLEYLYKKGAKTAIIDSGSHSHDGPGGVLEMHDQLRVELARRWGCSEEKADRSAWIEPKSQLNKLITGMGQMPMNLIWCFRAKEKSGKKPEDKLGFMPIVGHELAFEMTAMCLLYPGSDGIPTWDSRLPGERLMTKLPSQYRELFLTKFKGKPLSAAVGVELAQWAAGGKQIAPGPSGPARRPLSAPTPEPDPVPPPTSELASKEQVSELQEELGRLKWTTKQIREWCITYGGVWPDKIPGDRAISALQNLIARPDPA